MAEGSQAADLCEKMPPWESFLTACKMRGLERVLIPFTSCFCVDASKYRCFKGFHRSALRTGYEFSIQIK